ncbi:MAG: nicotinate-nucleotide--dimethylbenzimidazole phosphoribosyltransferase [Lentisphaerae bacterium RIFOXYB12_FULL_65_16]|nr:MAG: nicotinate-nucleotide--dimethylbenzimidazole phosphoribosyltransferase [Lentisphaerae bacterium RIFOXYA12_64_32]OGV86899.1 MAG: nicotinate-nucleotide--dimethylbenzimidazole phosphoribosyltransferase [Lentisphaerae bacterium RIFOXYB12_FULL_65_16]
MLYKKTIAAIKPLDEAAMQAARARQDTLTKPPGSLGVLEAVSVQLAGIAGTCPPPIPARKAVLVFAGDHGVVAQGVSAFPQEVTPQMVYNFLRGGAGINVLARQAGARVTVVDAGVAAELSSAPNFVQAKVALGTQDISVGPAMSRDQAVAALDAGVRAAQAEFKRGIDLLVCGEMGIGNTTPAAAIIAAVTGRKPVEIAGPGTGIDSDRLRHKVAVIEKCLAVNRPNANDGLDVLTKIGGFEIGAMAGAMLAAAAERVPVVVDGFIATSAAVIAVLLAPDSRACMISGHRSAEPGHDAALAWLKLTPLLDLRLRLGEGTGAMLATHLVEASARILREMATFAEAGVSGKSPE